VVEQGVQLTDLLGVAGLEIRQKLRGTAELMRGASGSGGGGRRWPWRRR
jgi:hypothetical protein